MNNHDLLLPLTKDELVTLWRNCQLATEKLVTRTDGWGMLCYKKAETYDFEIIENQGK